MVTQSLFLPQDTVMILRSLTKVGGAACGVLHSNSLIMFITGIYAPTMQKAPTAVASALQSVGFASNFITLNNSTKYHKNVVYKKSRRFNYLRDFLIFWDIH